MKPDIVIVGAGFAGAATAFHLTQLTHQTIVIVEQEEIPGFHASGRNASLLMQSVESPDIRRLLVNSRRAYENATDDLILSRNGSLLLGTDEELEALREPDLLETELREPDQVRTIVPLLEGHSFHRALFTPSDAVIDISRLLQYYLEGAQGRGARLLLRERVEDLHFDGRFRIRTTSQELEADYLINAAGAWAGKVGGMIGGASLPLDPLKRHLFVLGDIHRVPDDWPFVWSISQNFYFRPESGQLLFSICDEQSCQSLEPTVEREVVEDLAELIWRELPALREAVQKRVWSCFRTKTPDGQFVIGWDPSLPNLFWVAGLGGHGMGSSWEVGRIAAELFTHRAEDPGPFDPRRFIQTDRKATRPSGVES
ncbi:MAG TPA: FAD-dependent oxidoreductase [Acidobacteriota bacterium]|nr:FAD-dependent oxidoreductase [Acidobacteriota bacterium]